MQQSHLDTDIGRAEFKMINDQDHFESEWEIMKPIVRKYIDGFLNNISHINENMSPQNNFSAYLLSLINGGPASASSFVYSYIRNTLELQHIDYVVSTHPHLDHVYGLSSVLNAAPVDLVLTPVLEWDSKAFNSMVKYAEKQGAPLSVPQEGDTLQLGGATVTILHCWSEAIDYGRTNDSSIVVRIDYKQTSFIITGDAEDWSEYMMIDSGMNLKADVLRVAHHGSSTASTMEFLQSVQPKYAVISVGKDNGYGHPHQEVLERLNEVGSKILRTDELGTIVMNSNGETITLN